MVAKESSYIRRLRWDIDKDSTMEKRESVCERYTISRNYYGKYILVDTVNIKKIVCDSLEEAYDQAEFCV